MSGRQVAVTPDPSEAMRLVAEGHLVVLVVAPGASTPDCVERPGGGRLAVLVADPGDARSLELAAAMGADVFGP